MEKDYVPENKAHHKAKAGTKARKKEAAQAKKKGLSLDQQKARNPKVRLPPIAPYVFCLIPWEGIHFAWFDTQKISFY